MASATGNGVFLVTQYVPAVIPAPPAFLQTFMKGEPKALGAVQIMIGTIHVILGGTLCIVQYGPISIYSGIVFWGAISFFISGGLTAAAAASKKGDPCLVRGSLGMNIVSAIVAGTAFILNFIDLSTVPYFQSNCYYPYKCITVSYTIVMLEEGILAALLMLSLLEFCVSISSAAFGCKSICKCYSENGCCSGGACCACCSQAEPQSAQSVFILQNANPQDPTSHTAQTMGIPVFQGMPVTQMMPPTQGVIQGMPIGQGMRPLYDVPMTDVNANPPAVACVAAPPRGDPPSYSKTVYEEVR